VVGNWVPRHHSWDNPFITAPLPYENLTGIFDSTAAPSADVLLRWAHAGPVAYRGNEYADKYLRVPIIWGPSYASGAAVSGAVGKLDYALELKNASLSSRPEAWDVADTQWQHPTMSGRVGFRPDPRWNLGFSASTGTYLQASARPTLAAGHGLDDYRETVLGQDVSFAWHHLQVWAEVFETRFEIPLVGRADTTAYYVEAKYKFTPQFFGALRWNQQVFGTIRDADDGEVRWGRNVWRLDFGPAYRFTPHTQLKLQYSLQHDDGGARRYSNLLAVQFVMRF
jgi:predicted porin